jgi:hypothetical protein
MKECKLLKLPVDNASVLTLLTSRKQRIRLKSQNGNTSVCYALVPLTIERTWCNALKKKHAGLFIECKHNGKCSQIFQTEAEKSVHILEITNKKYKLIKCEFCCLMYSIKNQAYHFKIHHTNENLIRCSYNNCSTRFRSEVEKQNHEALVHALTRRQKCIFCNLFFAEDCLFHHYQRKHKSLLAKAFRCKFKCRKYFLTEADLEEHIASAHKRPMRAEVSVCTVTKYALINTC